MATAPCPHRRDGARVGGWGAPSLRCGQGSETVEQTPQIVEFCLGPVELSRPAAQLLK